MDAPAEIPPGNERAALEIRQRSNHRDRHIGAAQHHRTAGP